MKRHWLFVLIILSAPLARAASFDSLKESFELKWSGDLRIRAQYEALEGDEPRWSEKLRLRFGARASVDSDLFAEVRLASARHNRSTNQTLGDSKEPGFVRRFIGLDLAYVEWKPLQEVKLDLGRIPQVHDRPGGSQVLLDDDLALEGAAAVIDVPVSGHLGIFGSAGSTWIRENYDTYYSENQTDNMLNWAQFGLQLQTSTIKARLGGGFFNYVALQGRPFSEIVTGGMPLGNSATPAGDVRNQYLPRQFFFEGTVTAWKSDWGVFAERIVNSETDDPNDAVWTGFSFAKKPFDAQIGYANVQSDSVVALFTNSDFGNGMTDVRGVQASVRWTFLKGTSVRLTQFVNRVKSSADDLAYNRTHLDLSASF